MWTKERLACANGHLTDWSSGTHLRRCRVLRFDRFTPLFGQFGIFCFPFRGSVLAQPITLVDRLSKLRDEIVQIILCCNWRSSCRGGCRTGIGMVSWGHLKEKRDDWQWLELHDIKRRSIVSDCTTEWWLCPVVWWIQPTISDGQAKPEMWLDCHRLLPR